MFLHQKDLPYYKASLSKTNYIAKNIFYYLLLPSILHLGLDLGFNQESVVLLNLNSLNLNGIISNLRQGQNIIEKIIIL